MLSRNSRTSKVIYQSSPNTAGRSSWPIRENGANVEYAQPRIPLLLRSRLLLTRKYPCTSLINTQINDERK